MGKMALVLGGGAPNFTLMTGALLAFEEAGVKFDVVSGAGGGGAVALMYLSPNGMSRRDAMLNSLNLGVSDPIYRFMPMNYKVFLKGSAIAGLFRKGLTWLPFYDNIINQFGMTKGQKLVSDLIQAWWAAITPSTVNFFSSGLCAHAPWILKYVDFEELKTLSEDFYLNAFCLTDHKITVFDKQEIDFRHFGASLSYAFVYPPTNIDGKLYIEGASQDAFNFKGLLETDKEINTVVVFEAFDNQGYLQPPPNLWQAWGQSLITPLVALTKADMRLFEYYVCDWNKTHPERQIKLVTVKFDVPATWLPTALDWSSSNLERNFVLGYETGKKFVDETGATLGHCHSHSL